VLGGAGSKPPPKPWVRLGGGKRSVGLSPIVPKGATSPLQEQGTNEIGIPC